MLLVFFPHDAKRLEQIDDERKLKITLAAFGAVLHVISTSILGITAITITNTIAGEETVHKLASLLLIVLGGSYIILFLCGKGGHSHSHSQPMEKMAVAGLVLVPALSPCATTLPVFLAVGNSSSMMLLAIIVLLFRLLRSQSGYLTSPNLADHPLGPATDQCVGSIVVHAFTGTYGVNYGKISDNIPSPEDVLKLLRSNKIKNIRIYDADHRVLRAFSGSGIEISVCLPNELLIDASRNGSIALEWIKLNLQPFLPDTSISGIAVGNEILGGDIAISEALVPAVKSVYRALRRLRLSDTIEVSTPHSEAIFSSTYPPSNGTFKESMMPYLGPLLHFFNRVGSPFYINAYPFLAYKFDPSHIDINYALFQPNKGIVDPKTKLHYDNMFDAMVDATYVALEKVGYKKMPVIVSETGWASKGDDSEPGATPKNARTYNFNLHKRLMLKKGTPYRPKMVAKGYVFALFNENLKPGPTSERNFGLFKADGSIAYDMGFKGLVPSSASSKDFVLRGQFWNFQFLIIVACATILMLFIE
ncbi:Glucan endo-1,3-beta-glucosidase 11 [Capsicum chinense]|nr:Glucan endo-1,3-beta-glucosidase 11 [Capsicum chinense]